MTTLTMPEAFLADIIAHHADGRPLPPLAWTEPAELAHLNYRWPRIKFTLPL